MKTKTFKLTILLVIFFVGMNCISIGQLKAGDKKIKGNQLLKNNSLNNWVFYLKDQSVDPSTVFTIKEGVVHITGNPFGYMRTKKPIRIINFMLNTDGLPKQQIVVCLFIASYLILSG